MQITYVIIISIVTYIFGSITKYIIKIPTKYIPLQNVLIALVSTFICYFGKIEPNFLNAFVLCFSATMGAGGTYDFMKLMKKNTTVKNNTNS